MGVVLIYLTFSITQKAALTWSFAFCVEQVTPKQAKWEAQFTLCTLCMYYVPIYVQELHIDIEEMVSDIYDHFCNSQPRKQKLEEFCTFLDTDYKPMLLHVRTRWLSLVRVIERVFKQYNPLKSYFLSSGNTLSKNNLKYAFS